MNRLAPDRPAVVFTVLALAVVTLLHACWSAPFYKIDDERYIGLSVRRPLQRLFTPLDKHQFVPVTFLSLRLDYWLFGPPLSQTGRIGFQELGIDDTDRAGPLAPGAPEVNWAPAPRVMNGLYHLLAAVVLWWLLLRLGAGFGVAAFVAVAWAAHPLALESVAWVCERKNVLAALFGFGTLLAWTAPQKFWRWPLVHACFALAVFSKPSALGFLPLLFVLQLFGTPAQPLPDSRGWRSARHWFRSGLLLLVPASLSLAVALVTTRVHGGLVVEPPGGGVMTAIMTDAEVFTRYVINILLPVNLSFFYSVIPVVSLADPRLWLGCFVLFALFGTLVAAAGQRYRFWSLLGIVWLFSALSTNANIIATVFYMQDRYIYLSTPGLLLAVCAAFCGLVRRQPRMARAVRVAACAFVALLFVLLGQRSALFASSDQLELDAALRQPGSALARLSAARVMSGEFYAQRAKGDAAAAEKAALAAVSEYAAIESCPDARLFIDVLSGRVRRAELLLELGKFQGVKEVLKGWLPPPDVPMLKLIDDNGLPIKLRQSEYYKGYAPNTLAQGWLLLAAACEAQAGLPALAERADVRLQLYTQAVDALSKSLEAHRLDYQAPLVKARVLGLLRNLNQGLGRADEVAQNERDFVDALKSIPAPRERASAAHRKNWQDAQMFLSRLPGAPPVP
jgi:hypothetical protein